MQSFNRLHHQHIAQVLAALNAPIFRDNLCLFAGGTVIAMRYGEYRESVDMDFLVSDITCYRNMRLLLTSPQGVAAVLQENWQHLIKSTEIRADQYGIRTTLQGAQYAIKFEIVLEGRIKLDIPSASDELCGIATLTPLDMAAGKLLANSDRWADDGVFSRDIIDLAMMQPSRELLLAAIAKAETAYGASIRLDLDKALTKLQNRHGWLERCMQVMSMTIPKAVLWQRLRALRRVCHQA